MVEEKPTGMLNIYVSPKVMDKTSEEMNRTSEEVFLPHKRRKREGGREKGKWRGRGRSSLGSHEKTFPTYNITRL
jgi:hypothetical protein